MSRSQIACVHSPAEPAVSSFRELQQRYPFVPVDQADVIIVLGGDGFMLHALHQYMNLDRPIYGMNRGTVGFLMNTYRVEDLPQRIAAAQQELTHPLAMTAITVDGQTRSAIAFNEVVLSRQSAQTAHIRVVVNGKQQIENLMGDGILVATPAGSTAYNFSAHGPILPLGSGLLALTPISPARPRRWRGALLPHTATIELFNRDCDKRPLQASADFDEIADIQSVLIREDRSKTARLLFDPDHSLEQRIIAEQFAH